MKQKEEEEPKGSPSGPSELISSGHLPKLKKSRPKPEQECRTVFVIHRVNLLMPPLDLQSDERKAADGSKLGPKQNFKPSMNVKNRLYYAEDKMRLQREAAKIQFRFLAGGKGEKIAQEELEEIPRIHNRILASVPKINSLPKYNVSKNNEKKIDQTPKKTEKMKKSIENTPLKLSRISETSKNQKQDLKKQKIEAQQKPKALKQPITQQLKAETFFQLVVILSTYPVQLYNEFESKGHNSEIESEDLSQILMNLNLSAIQIDVVKAELEVQGRQGVMDYRKLFEFLY